MQGWKVDLPIYLAGAQEIERHQTDDLYHLQVRVVEDGFGIHTQQSRSGEIDEMVSFVAFPFRVNQMRIFCTDRKNHIENGKPLFGRSLHRAADESLKLTGEIESADDGKGRVDPLHVDVEEMGGDLGRG